MPAAWSLPSVYSIVKFLLPCLDYLLGLMMSFEGFIITFNIRCFIFSRRSLSVPLELKSSVSDVSAIKAQLGVIIRIKRP